jgi:ubiquitin carboxyl-terminal hydrolase 5/13
VNLNTWYGVGIEFLSLDSTKSGNSLYLHELWRFVPKKQPEEDMPVQAEAPSKLAIGVEGGFNIGESKYELEQTYQLCYVNPDGSVDRMDLPSENLPDSVSMCVDAIIKHAGMSHRQAVEQWEGDTERPVSK